MLPDAPSPAGIMIVAATGRQSGLVAHPTSGVAGRITGDIPYGGNATVPLTLGII